MDRWVVLDVGETLIDESRIWAIWADVLGIPRLTFMAVLGAAVERGGGYGRIFDEFAIDEPTWRARVPEVEERYGGFREQDLYPDAHRAVDALAGQGYHVGLVANQPASRTAELRALGFDTEVIAMSDEMGVAKPDPAFFARVLEMAGNPDPRQVAYAGDRVDNDVIPAAAAGMRAIWVRRGPWGLIQQVGSATPALTVVSLDELAAKIGEAWPGG
ncbi:MAG TPA: HAD family hydrolase [Candidatus Limnocylindria bacterium]|jgi:HAD superfamily hydrolase (TIGR01549 family)